MSIRKYSTVKCDGAGCYARVSVGGTAADARAAAREQDWLTGVKGGRDFCANHKDTGTGEPPPPVPQQREST